MDSDYHESLCRLVTAYVKGERELCNTILESTDAVLEQNQNCNIQSDMNHLLSELSLTFVQPPLFHFSNFKGDNENVNI